MATVLTKPITRLLKGATIRDRGKVRPLEITVYPNGTVVLRPVGTQRGGDLEVSIRLATAYMDALYRRCR